MKNIISYDGRYWLVHKYGRLFDDDPISDRYLASPIYEEDGNLVVRPGGSDNCYVHKGARLVDFPREKEVYRSWIQHLDWTLSIMAMQNYPEEIKRLEKEKELYKNMLDIS